MANVYSQCRATGFIILKSGISKPFKRFFFTYPTPLSKEVASYGIDVTIIYPIWSETDMLKSPCFGSLKVLRPPSFFIVKPETIVRASVKGIKKRRLHVYADVFTKVSWWVCKLVPMIGIMPTETKTNS
ncbi:MAG: hypothetical protein ABIG42_09940 [bacterium]